MPLGRQLRPGAAPPALPAGDSTPGCPGEGPAPQSTYPATRLQGARGPLSGTYARIARLQHAYGLLRASAGGSLSDVAYRCGYADHAHMTREFRELTGRPPSAFRLPG
ncbi:helix-turn-helix domain-containing protein [Cystobacter fuscus]